MLFLVLGTFPTYSMACLCSQVENSGDFYPLVPRGTFNGQVVSYWRCFLYLYGKVTLIDLSGIRIQTRLGKLIIYAFQLIALVWYSAGFVWAKNDLFTLGYNW